MPLSYCHPALRPDSILEIAMLLKVLNARTKEGWLPIDMPNATEEIKQAIRDEPRRRMDEASHRARPASQCSHITFSTTGRR